MSFDIDFVTFYVFLRFICCRADVSFSTLFTSLSTLGLCALFDLICWHIVDSCGSLQVAFFCRSWHTGRSWNTPGLPPGMFIYIYIYMCIFHFRIVIEFWLPFGFPFWGLSTFYCITYSSMKFVSICHRFWDGFSCFWMSFPFAHSPRTKPREPCFWTTLWRSALKLPLLTFQKNMKFHDFHEIFKYGIDFWWVLTLILCMLTIMDSAIMYVSHLGSSGYFPTCFVIELTITEHAPSGTL